MTNYLCPKCGNTMACMATASIPAYITYQCFSCGYSSKTVRETETYPILPEWLREEEATSKGSMLPVVPALKEVKDERD